jgi:hypothetical protein
LLMLPMLIIVYYGYPGTQKCFALHTFFWLFKYYLDEFQAVKA